MSRHRDLGGEEELSLIRGSHEGQSFDPARSVLLVQQQQSRSQQGSRFGSQTILKIPSAGWNASDLDRMLLVASVLLVLAGPGAAALDRLWWEREEVGKA